MALIRPSNLDSPPAIGYDFKKGIELRALASEMTNTNSIVAAMLRPRALCEA
jgi:hypothetical protein